jgi:hypothetical protein
LLLDQWRCRDQLNRKKEYDFYKAVAGAVLLKFQPTEKGLSYTRSGLLLVLAAAAETRLEFKASTHTVRCYDFITSNQFSKALGRICAYPSHMLTQEPDVVWTVVEALRGLRSFSVARQGL